MVFRFTPFPRMPTYVASENSQLEIQSIEPFVLSDDPDADWRQLKEILASMERTEVVSKTESHIHAVCWSKRIGFRDDVEFRLCVEEGVIHIRSASRIGPFWDFGVNRERLEKIRCKLQTG